MEAKLEDLIRERDNIVTENDGLREKINEFFNRASKLEAAQTAMENKIIEVKHRLHVFV
jgi:predicted nuclease with TOPRIM domain